MRCLTCLLSLAAAVVLGLPAHAQSRVASKPSVPHRNTQDQASRVSLALKQTADSGKYALVLFWKERNPATDRAWQVLQAAAPTVGEWADTISVQVTDPSERAIVDKFGMSRAPLPLVLSIAPSGAVTKAFQGKLEEADFTTARVSRSEELCLKGLQERKLVFVCVQAQAPPADAAVVPAGVRQMQADAQYGPVTAIVTVDSADAGEASFLKDLKIEPRGSSPVTILLAPPGSVVGSFDATVTKQQIVAKLAASQASCCPGGKCGPNGCGPKR